MTTRAIFLDKDGTLVEDVPMNVDPARVKLVPGALDALIRLHALGFRFAVVSNQAGVAHGAFAEEALEPIAERLRSLLGAVGVPLDGFFYCPHHPDGKVARYRQTCHCRKPAPGLVVRAARHLGANLACSWFVGDILDDVEAGTRAGCRTVLLDSGGETEWVTTDRRTPDIVARSFGEVADRIIAAEARLA
jgi:histidinol-phosphate phosphatase family protein